MNKVIVLQKDNVRYEFRRRGDVCTIERQHMLVFGAEVSLRFVDPELGNIEYNRLRAMGFARFRKYSDVTWHTEHYIVENGYWIAPPKNFACEPGCDLDANPLNNYDNADDDFVDALFEH